MIVSRANCLRTCASQATFTANLVILRWVLPGWRELAHNSRSRQYNGRLPRCRLDLRLRIALRPLVCIMRFTVQISLTRCVSVRVCGCALPSVSPAALCACFSCAVAARCTFEALDGYVASFPSTYAAKACLMMLFLLCQAVGQPACAQKCACA